MCVKDEYRAQQLSVPHNLEHAEDLWIAVTSQSVLTISICVCYHPPHKPIYDSEALVNQTIKHFEHWIHTNANDVYILTGDLNQIDISMFEVDLGFVQLVKEPTHKTNILDKYQFDVQVIVPCQDQAQGDCS